MRRFLWAAVLVCVSYPAAAADISSGKLRWVRRLTMIGACAASFWDVQTTMAGVSAGVSAGARGIERASGEPRKVATRAYYWD